jgi:hypothetical protein
VHGRSPVEATGRRGAGPLVRAARGWANSLVPATADRSAGPCDKTDIEPARRSTTPR